MSYYSSVVLSDNPAAYLRLGESSGTTAFDQTANHNNGTLHGGITLSQGGAIVSDTDTAMLFDGSTGYISLPSTILTANHDASVEAWVQVSTFNQDGTSTDRRIVFNNIDGTNAIQLATKSPGTFVFAANDSAGQHITSTSGFNINTYYHLVGVWVAATKTATLYINGSAGANNGGASGYGIGVAAFNLAVRNSSGFLPGLLDEVAIYAYALSQLQILNHTRAGLGLYPYRLSATVKNKLSLSLGVKNALSLKFR